IADIGDGSGFCVPRELLEFYDSRTPMRGGTFGDIMLLRGQHPCRPVAVKKFVDAFTSKQRAKRCYRELQLLSALKRIKHENIVELWFAYVTDLSADKLLSVYFAMYYAGDDLCKLIQEETAIVHRFSVRGYKSLLSQMLRALLYLISAGVIHRDLKPANLAVDATGKLTVIDFGLARSVEKNDELTADPGTPAYRAIEACTLGISRTPLVYDEKAEMWSVGAILCEMLTGKVLFDHPQGNCLITAIQVCGSIPENVLARISDKTSQKDLRRRTAVRANFLAMLTAENGRRWLRKEIFDNRHQLINFIDRTLVFDHKERMTVEDALAHPFLAEVREPRREVRAQESFPPDAGEKTVDEWKRLIHESARNSMTNDIVQH
ncbi:hypothetical protein PFISCL1PPCAC_13765, partial [Pristionchus fissidentatus]